MSMFDENGHFQWDRPASDHDPRLPSDVTMREFVKRERDANGLTWKEIVAEFHLPVTPECACSAAHSRAGEARRARGGSRISPTDKDRQRVAAAYGVDPEELALIRKSGLTVLEWKLKRDELKEEARQPWVARA